MLGDLGERDRLAVLQLEHGDLVADRRRRRRSAGPAAGTAAASTGSSSWALATVHSRGATATTTAVTSRAPAATTSPRRASQVSGRTVRRGYRRPSAGTRHRPARRRSPCGCRSRRDARWPDPSRTASVPLRRPAVRARPTPRAGSSRPARIEDLGYSTVDDARPLHRPARPDAGAVGGRRGDDDAAHRRARVRQRLQAPASCWPRSWRRMDVLSGGRVEIGLGAGWMESDYRAAGMPYDRPGVRIDRFEEALAVIKGAMADGAVLVRRRALHDHRLRRPAEAGAAPAPAAPDRRRRAAGAVDRRPRGRHRRHQRHPDRRRDRPGGDRDDDPRGRRRAGRHRARGRRRRASTTSS